MKKLSYSKRILCQNRHLCQRL